MSLFYRCEGDVQHPPLVLLHGFLGNHKDWDQIVSCLKKDFYCIFMDMPGHGQSMIDESNDSLAKCADQIKEILDVLNIKQAHLLGYSMGGRIALYTILAYPERFRSLIMEGSCPGLKTEAEQADRVKNDAYIAKRIEKERDNFRGYLDKWYEQPFFKSLKADAMKYDAFLKSRLENDPMQVAYALRALGTGAQPSLWNRLLELDVPVCLIVGENDSKFFGFAEDMRQGFSQSELHVITACGHNVHVEKPQEYVTILAEFLREREPNQ